MIGARANRRILYIQPSFVPPPRDPEMDRFYWLSQTLEGDVLQPVWFRDPKEVEAEFGPGSYPVYTRGRFRYHWFLAWRFAGLRRRLEIFRFYLREGLRLLRKHDFDCVVAYSHMTTGVLAAVLKLLSGTKSVVEIVTAPDLVYLNEKKKPGLRERLLHFYSDFCLHISVGLADCVHLLYPSALSSYPRRRNKANAVFHEFVAVSRIPCCRRRANAEKFLLLVGAPWFPKGVDLMIEAFREISPEFPQLKLKLLGYYDDQPGLSELIGDSAQIEVLKARPNPEALEIIAAANALILPSRCEGMPRVLLEAMAAGVPVIGSRVGGIPWLLCDGECGLLVPANDAKQLSARLRELLADSDAARRVREAGYRRAHTELNEANYVAGFTAMIEETAPKTI